MRVTFYFPIFWMNILLYVNANQGKYTAIVPNTIYANDKYTVAVAIHFPSTPCHVNVSLSGPAYNASKSVQVLQNEVKHVEFDVPDLEASDDFYYVNIASVNCSEKFKNATEIFFNEIKHYEIIQTDRGLYKFGDEINFRVLFVNKDLKPVEPAPDAVIWFKDGRYNTVKEITAFKTTNGVYTGKFKIPEQPVAGKWILGVQNNGRFERRSYFFVDNIRSKYIVTVEANKLVSMKDGDMQIVVRANYISGTPIDGTVTVMLSAIGVPRVYFKYNMVDGRATIDFNVRDEFLDYITKSTEITIKATVKDKITRDKITATTHSFIHPYLYTITCTHPTNIACSSFEADKETDVHFQMKYLNGSFVNDTKSIVEIEFKEVLHKHPHYPGIVPTEIQQTSVHDITFEAHMNETGFINLKLSLPALSEHEGYLHYYKVSYKYLDEGRDILFMYQSREDKSSRNHLTLAHPSSNDKIRVNEMHQITINSSQPLSYLVYSIVSSRNIVKSGRVDMPEKTKVYNLALTPEPSWAPKFHLYVYYVDENGGYHYAEQTYHINEQQNPITVTADEHAEPGKEVTFKIQTAPNSFVGLMAVDQRVLLLEENRNSLSTQLEDLNDYSPFMQTGISKFPGKSTGCVTLTNANYDYNWETLTRPVLAASFDAANKDFTSQNSAVKEAFPLTSSSNAADNTSSLGTWIFEDIVTTNSSESTWSKKLPETRTTWILTAFSVHPSKGLGVTEKELKITTY